MVSLLNDEAEEEGVEDGRKGELVFMLSFVEKLVLDVWLMSASWNILNEVFGKVKRRKEKKKKPFKRDLSREVRAPFFPKPLGRCRILWESAQEDGI